MNTKCVSRTMEGNQQGYENWAMPENWSGVRLVSKASPTVICKKSQ